MVDRALDLEKAVEIDPVGGSLSVGRSDPSAPGAIEVEVHDAAKSDVSSIKGLWRQQQALFEEFAKG